MQARRMLKDMQQMEVEIGDVKFIVGDLEIMQQFLVIAKFFAMGGTYSKTPKKTADTAAYTTPARKMVDGYYPPSDYYTPITSINN